METRIPFALEAPGSEGSQLIQQLDESGIRSIDSAYFGVFAPLPETWPI